MSRTYNEKEEVYSVALSAKDKTLRDYISEEKISEINGKIEKYGSNRKGYFGNLVETIIFDIENNNRAEPDFPIPKVELKTTPLKKGKNGYSSKERLVFSMIDYCTIINENWENSSFLKKNGLLLLMFYLYSDDLDILDYEFKFIYLLNLVKDISDEDVNQIRRDWELIVSKVKKGEAHLLSEGDTYYLGACTKASNNSVTRKQPCSDVPAKPRAFSLKQSYINYIIQEKLLGKNIGDSILRGQGEAKSIEEATLAKFKNYIGKTDKEIIRIMGCEPVFEGLNSKGYKRMLSNWILIGSRSNKIEELEKANITLKTIVLEPSGVLKESISFPYFDYIKILEQKWYDKDNGSMADFHSQLETKKFLFVIFQKIKGSNDIILRKVMFWNFPMEDINKVKSVFDKTIKCIKNADYSHLPKISDNEVAHVRPHGKDSRDTILTPQGTQEVKRCFWLNAKYIEKILGFDQT